MKILKKIILFLLVVFLIAQFFGPKKNDGTLASVEPFLLSTNPPEAVVAILKESCFDCHSNYTKYPWYSKITPVNYWLADHVNEGKEDFNVSIWSEYSVKQKDHKFKELIETVESREMPLDSYILTHNEANLTDTQIASVIEWSKKMRIIYGLKPKGE
ncbi:heme-binding domain-containing protein [Bizionia myxarmorum]|uniref:Cytochrome C n=1 Tax=Bizionia myxarmorum TaxID=291186 RepID=A0A5D0R6V9_9FLAO|nr:heme-binding domain-containing protein [Bizionia myxarmorum]TYB77207.1 cytochrome C [Bizionia myxarmorum]